MGGLFLASVDTIFTGHGKCTSFFHPQTDGFRPASFTKKKNTQKNKTDGRSHPFVSVGGRCRSGHFWGEFDVVVPVVVVVPFVVAVPLVVVVPSSS